MDVVAEEDAKTEQAPKIVDEGKAHFELKEMKTFVRLRTMRKLRRRKTLTPSLVLRARPQRRSLMNP